MLINTTIVITECDGKAHKRTAFYKLQLLAQYTVIITKQRFMIKVCIFRTKP